MTHTFDFGGFFTFLVALAHGAPFSSCGELKKNLTETKFVAQRQKRLNIIFKFLGHSKLISFEKNFNVVCSIWPQGFTHGFTYNHWHLKVVHFHILKSKNVIPFLGDKNQAT